MRLISGMENLQLEQNSFELALQSHSQKCSRKNLINEAKAIFHQY